MQPSHKPFIATTCSDQLLTTIYANGATETNTYNAAGLTMSTANQTNDLSEYKYGYYYNGSQKTKIGNDGTTAYIYDGRGQLIETDMSNGTVQECTFDDNGNRLTMKETPENATTVITAYTYDANDRLITETKGNLTSTYTYDSNGNQLTKTASGSQTLQTHEFDNLNRMTRYHDGTTNVSYRYYPDNMRKSKKVGNVTTTHVWLEDEIALDMTANHVVNYIHGAKLVISDYGWYHYNAHGDVVQLSDDNGDVTRDYDYDPYGNIIQSTSGTDENPYRYSGEYYDVESGYTYLRARYYDPSIGRFISEDLALDGINWYTYCWNDPINMIDPTGLIVKKVIDTFNKLTIKEKMLIVKHPFSARNVQKCRNATFAIGKAIFKKRYNDDLVAANAFRHTLWNAFRHTLWNAFMTIRIGEKLAKEFADAHEDGTNQDGVPTLMDYHNNEKGREIGRKYLAPVNSRYYATGKSLTQRVVDDVMNAFKQKKLYWCSYNKKTKKPTEKRTYSIPNVIKKYKSRNFSVDW